MSYYLKKFWKTNLLAVMFQIIVYGLAAFQNLVKMQYLQCVIEWDFRGFLFWVLISFAILSFYAIFNVVQTFFQSRAIRAMNSQVRTDIAVTLLQKQHQEYHAQDTGEYLSWFTTGVSQIEGNAWSAFFSFTAYTAQVVCSIIALASLSWTLIPIALLLAIPMIVVPKLFESKLERMGEACAQGEASGVSGMKDMLGGYDVLRSFGRLGRFIGEVGQANDKIEDPQYQKKCKSAIIYNGIGIIKTACQLLGNGFIGFLSFRGVIIQTALFGGGTLLNDIGNGLYYLAYYRLCFSTSKPYFARITVHDDGGDPERPQGPEPVKEAITVENLDFAYGEKTVLADFSATFEKGKKYALTGPSGCGKSTLLKLILGWLPDYEGTIRFDGRDAKNYTPEQLQQQMSYIAQDVFLFNTTIRDNITLGEDFTEEEMEKALRDSALAGDIVNMPLGLDTPVGEEGSSLSGGQRQRVAIARALIHNRSILLVDEGTSALDQKNASIVEESLLANPDLTLLLVSHHLTPERREQFDWVYDLKQAA